LLIVYGEAREDRDTRNAGSGHDRSLAGGLPASGHFVVPSPLDGDLDDVVDDPNGIDGYWDDRGWPRRHAGDEVER
jgi:hypothetical protein